MIWLQFIGALLIAVLFHELAHLIVALLCGVKVEAFSIGFWKPYLHKRLWGIDFRITPWLLGGYTKLSGEGDKCPNGFLAQRYLKKAAILLAGVTVNFIIACICYLIMYKSISVGLYVDFTFMKASLTQDYGSMFYIFQAFNPNFFLLQLSFINLFCAIINIIPFPALDGGTLWLLWLEKVFKDKFPKFLNVISKVGFWLLMALQVWFIYWVCTR